MAAAGSLPGPGSLPTDVVSNAAAGSGSDGSGVTTAAAAEPAASDNAAASALPCAPVLKREGSGSAGSLVAEKKRLSFYETVEAIEYEPGVRDEYKAPDDYKKNMQTMAMLRQTQRGMSFHELVRELDFQEGGEAISHLKVFEKKQPEDMGLTWAQIMSTKYGALNQPCS